MLFARCITGEKDNGVYPFLIQVRDMKTHKPLSGIEIGDVGTKLAFSTTDNGFLILKNFRQPKESLLSRYVSVSDEGNFSSVGEEATRLAYGGMLKLRISIAFSISYILGRMATIAVRFSHHRRQFEGKEGKKKPEVAIIEYQMQ